MGYCVSWALLIDVEFCSFRIHGEVDEDENPDDSVFKETKETKVSNAQLTHR